jgi:hypothetical protein
MQAALNSDDFLFADEEFGDHLKMCADCLNTWKEFFIETAMSVRRPTNKVYYSLTAVLPARLSAAVFCRTIPIG